MPRSNKEHVCRVNKEIKGEIIQLVDRPPLKCLQQIMNDIIEPTYYQMKRISQINEKWRVVANQQPENHQNTLLF